MLASIRGILFDLDSCLAAADEPGRALFAPAFEAIRRANDGSVSDASLAVAFEACWRFPFDEIATHHHFTAAMTKAGFDAFEAIEVTTPMTGYGDLDVLARLDVSKFLVTSGFPRLQESKVRALGIGALFVEVHVDALGPGRRGKRALFESIATRHHMVPSEVMVVGDNPASEIASGNALGFVTVQILRPGVDAVGVGDNAPAFVVRDLSEVARLLHQANST